MKTYLLSILFFLTYFSSLNAQGERAIFIELGGRGIFYSLNFDFRFSENYQGLGITGGFEILPIPQESGGYNTFISTGIELNKIWGDGNWHPEFGVGLDYIRDDDLNLVLPRLTAAI